MTPQPTEIWNVAAGCFLLVVACGIALHTLIRWQRGQGRPAATGQAAPARAESPRAVGDLPDIGQVHADAMGELVGELFGGAKAKIKAQAKAMLREVLAEMAADPKDPARPS